MDATLTEAQRAWMDLGMGMMIHFSINTFYDLEWSDGTLDPAGFNPTHFEPDSWFSAARAAGMRFIVITTKHHDGFCIWPTRYTNYNCTQTPFNRDVLGEIIAAARRHGLQVGLYYSLWDRHEPSHDDDAAYAAFMRDQLTELLTGYGPIVELWFDGMWAKMPANWHTLSADGLMAAWRSHGAPRWGWDALYAHIKSLQPDCTVINNATTHFPGIPLWPVDARPGEKSETQAVDRKVWTFDGHDVYLPMQMEYTLSVQGPTGVFSDGSWYWHAWDHSARDIGEVVSLRALAQRSASVLLLNVGPSREGLLRPEDEALLRRLGEIRQEG